MRFGVFPQFNFLSRKNLDTQISENIEANFNESISKIIMAQNVLL